MIMDCVLTLNECAYYQSLQTSEYSFIQNLWQIERCSMNIANQKGII